jgi:hypothetical protein
VPGILPELGGERGEERFFSALAPQILADDAVLEPELV